MSKNYVKLFEEQGFFVIPALVGVESCRELQREIIAAFDSSPQTVIKEPAFRRHTPLPLTEGVLDTLDLVLQHGHSVLSNFLKNQQELVELSSISVFPHAKAQALHRDEANTGHYLASVFINLADTSADGGALQLIPGSHRMEEGGVGEAIAMELPRGSALFMNSKLLHGGGANTTSDRIRSVFYFTVGEANLYGPPYSILASVAKQGLTLDQLKPREGQGRVACDKDSRPQLRSDCRILMPLSEEDGRTELYLCVNSRVWRRLLLGDDDEKTVDLLQCIECHPRELTIADLAERFALPRAELLKRVSTLAADGWLCW